MGPAYFITIIGACASLVLLPGVSSKESRRFLLDFYSCQACYDCVCDGKMYECLEGLFSRDVILSSCPKYVNRNQDCTAPYHRGGAWSGWSHWSSCQGPCGQAVQQRARTCSNPPPANCGDHCPDSNKQQRSCTPGFCHTTLPPPPPTTMRPTTTTKTTTTTTTKATTTSTTATTTMTTQTPPSCSKFCAVAAVAMNHTANVTSASTCQDGRHHSSDALPIQCCHLLQQPHTWTRGQNVLLNCGRLPEYAPVAQFDGPRFVPGTAGIFVNCLQNGETGFRFIHQSCDKLPELVHVSLNSTEFARNVIKYYVILE